MSEQAPQPTLRRSRAGLHALAAVAVLSIPGLAACKSGDSSPESGQEAVAEDPNRTLVHEAYESLEVSDIFDTEVTEIRVGEPIPSPYERGMAATLHVTLDYGDGDRAEEFRTALPTDDSAEVELMWGNHGLRVDNRFETEEGTFEEGPGSWPSYEDGSQRPVPSSERPGELYLDPDPATVQVVIPMSTNWSGTREVTLVESFETHVRDTGEDRTGESRVVSQELGSLVVDVRQDGSAQILDSSFDT